MKTKTIRLWQDSSISSELVIYNSTNTAPQPAVLVIPGGGYACVCEDTEGGPIAERFAKLGFKTFVLHYRVAPHRFPEPLQDALRAMKLIRGNATAWNVVPNNIAVCGFSAGGHLACSLGTIYNMADASCNDEFDAIDPVPNAMLLAYPVITAGEFAHRGSVDSYFGASSSENDNLFSLEKHISDKTPPAFLWSTVEDKLVPCENSIMFFDKMREIGRPTELHIFPQGGHGMQLGYGRGDIGQWPEQAAAFLHETCKFSATVKHPRKIVLTFDDSPKSHIENVAPILKQYGFGATFFITRFDDAWRARNGESQMKPEDIRKLSELGFEIGNHTWNHECGLEAKSDAEIEKEILDLEHYLTEECAAPKPVSYAYPGGPYSAKTASILKRLGYKFARSVRDKSWNPKTDDAMNIPALSVRNGSDWDFLNLLISSHDGEIPVLVFHGVPDIVHPHVNTDIAQFKKFMAFLNDNGWQCVSLVNAMTE